MWIGELATEMVGIFHQLFIDYNTPIRIYDVMTDFWNWCDMVGFKFKIVSINLWGW